MVETHFTCIGRGHGAPVLPATRSEWEAMRREPQLARMCRDIVQGNERLKAKLPVWTPCCAAFKDNHRSVKDALKPLPRLMLDFDEKGHSREILAAALRLQEQGRWEILLVEESVRRGTHVLITLPPGMTPQEAQTRFSADVGFTADPALKDIARCIYMVPAENTLYTAPKLFTPEAVAAPETPAEASPAAATETPSEAPLGRPSEATDDYPSAYNGIPYSLLVETLEEQMGGRPEHGSRNTFIFSMACHLRHVCDDDPDRIARILPAYGEARDKWMATIRSACARSQPKHLPAILRRTLALCEAKNEECTADGGENPALLPPELPRRLPPLIRLLVSRTPKVYRPAVASAVFPALGAHLWRTTFRYIDNTLHEATLASVLMAGTGAGKSCICRPIDFILADIRERDRLSMERERKWKQETQTRGANKDKRARPEGIVVQEIDADVTSAAFVQRMADADGRFLYARMNEIEQFNNLSPRGNSKGQFQLMCLAFDYGNVYGQTRVGTGSVSERVCVRFNYNISTTVRKGQAYFRSVLTDGPISRLSFCTIPQQPIGAEMPVYGSYDTAFEEELRPYIERLNDARGLVECRPARMLAKRLMEENAEFARLSQSRVYENLSFRANVIAFIKAMVLYVAHGEVWDKTMEEFVRWSLRYDLWCKMHFFGRAIEEQECADDRSLHPGPRNLLDLLPEVFTREEADLMRRRQGIRTGSLKHMLSNWKKRGYIEVYGDELPAAEIARQRYAKTEEYLKAHPQPPLGEGGNRVVG